MSVIDKPWMIDQEDFLDHYQVESVQSGLTTKQVVHYREIYGLNEIPPGQSTSLWKLILQQFEDRLVLILLGAAAISFILALTEENFNITAFVEPLVILVILICNATVGVLQETKAESAIEKLKETEASQALVIRNKKQQVIEASELVPGDIIIVQEGAKIPADARIVTLKSSSMLVEEPALTGESEPSQKISECLDEEDLSNGDKKNLLFSGSLCVKGSCYAVVIATGINTELGRIAHDLDSSNDTDDDDDDSSKTPLQRKLDEFGEDLSKVITVICILVWVINIGHFNDPIHGGSWVKGAIYYFKIAIALAVAAIPEGLPAVVTTCLAIGAQKMAKRGAIVRNLPSVETLGCTTVICSDKTGTLTTNMMSVQEIVVLSQQETPFLDDNNMSDSKDEIVILDKKTNTHLHHYAVFGDSWSPYGQVAEGLDDDLEIEYPSADVPGLTTVAQIATLCNEAFLTVTLPEQTDDDTNNNNNGPIFAKQGAATEASLLVLAEKLGTPDDPAIIAKYYAEQSPAANESCVDVIRSNLPLNEQVSYVNSYWKNRCEQEAILEFGRDRKSMSVIVNDKTTKQRILLCKGAAERILDRCNSIQCDNRIIPLTATIRRGLEENLELLNSKGLRTLAIAFTTTLPKVGHPSLSDDSQYEAIESKMTFVGFIGMLDPPRASVPDALAQCQNAGIRVVMITGDNQVTAESIAHRIGLWSPEQLEEDNLNIDDISFTGRQIDKLSMEQLQQIVKNARIFSRVEHHHKLKIVNALQANGDIVAMTGDGVNDATALSTADIGIAMGSGTSVAKEASKMVLQDDNFETIVMSVEEGRTIYANTKQFIRYLISSNIGEVACIFGISALGLPDALIPVQLLWVNLVTDGLPATALGVNPPDRDIMSRPPRSRSEPIIDSWLYIRYIVIGLYVGVGTILGYIWWFLYSPRGPQISYWTLTHFHQCSTSLAPEFTELIAQAQSGQIAGVSIPFDSTKEFICERLFENPIPSSVSLSILVTIEMFNAFNAISENQSILSVTPFANIYVVYAAILSFALHFVLLYVPWVSSIFQVAALNLQEWYIVLLLSFPVIFIDEILKFVSRQLASKKAENEAITNKKLD